MLFLDFHLVLFHCVQAGQLKILLQSVLDQWSIYKAAYEELNSYLMEARYSLSRFHLLTGSLEAVKVQVDNLQVRWGKKYHIHHSVIYYAKYKSRNLANLIWKLLPSTCF